ncbi:MAG: hypothetical protein Fur0041_03080 [Bacteroidia bacterium]
MSLHAQPESLSPLKFNALQYNASQASRSMSTFPSDTVVVPSSGIKDDFSYDSHRPDTVLWDLSLSPGVLVNRGWATAPVNIGVCTFDGLGWDGYPYNPLVNVNTNILADVLTTRPLDLSSYTLADSVYLSFWWQAQGKGYAPNLNDSFQLQFNIPAWNTSGEVWKTVWFKLGYTPAATDSNFSIAMIKLDSASYFVKGFRFRFRNYAAVCGSNDHWHLDEVYMKRGRDINDTIQGDVSFVYDMPSFLKDYHQIPGWHFQPSMMKDSVRMYIRNNDDLPRNVTYSYEVFDPSGAPLFNYSGGADGNLQPYATSGYSSYNPHQWPNVSPFAYPGLTSADTGVYKINHMLKKGTSTTAPVDTISYYQRFSNFYAYDDGSAEVGYGLYGNNSLLAYKFTLPVGVTDTLKAIQMHFLPVMDITNLDLREFKLMVWNHDAANNRPGSIIYSQRGATPDYTIETPNRFKTYTIDSGTVVLTGTFYIGWQQLAADRLYIGFDFNNDQSDKIYYNTSGVWYTSIYDGSLMMRPVFREPFDISGVSENVSGEAPSVYPNPSGDAITINGLSNDENYDVRILDISGRVVYSQSMFRNGEKIDVASFSNGVYFIQINDQQNKAAGTVKIVVSH